MVLTRVESPLAYGIVITDEAGRIVRFLEKPSWGEVFSDTINTGIYLLEPSRPRRRSRPAGLTTSARSCSRRSSRAGRAAVRPRGRRATGATSATSPSTGRAHLDLLQGQVDARRSPARRARARTTTSGWTRARGWTSSRASTGSVIIGRGATVAPGARLANCVVGPGCDGRRAGRASRAVCSGTTSRWGRARVLKEAIVGRRALIRANAFLAGGRGHRRLLPDRRVEPRSRPTPRSGRTRRSRTAPPWP